MGDAIAPLVITISSKREEMKVGERVRLRATVAPSNATYTDITWSSTDPAVATVENGLITAVGPGECDIVATCHGLRSVCQVRVTAPTKPDDMNGDGSLDIDDVTIMIGSVLGNNEVDIDVASADLNGDGAIDIDDITALINSVLGNFANLDAVVLKQNCKKYCGFYLKVLFLRHDNVSIFV